jgi:Cro/C1-type HTH DNA-binding domain
VKPERHLTTGSATPTGNRATSPIVDRLQSLVPAALVKNGRARAIRFSTLAALCQALGCQPGDLLSHQP